MYTVDWLGAVVLRREAAVLPLSIRKTLALLVLLARDGDMPRERIASLLWPALDERTARRNLRRELARLRDAGAGDVIRADGDRLAVVPEVEVTARVFESALRDDRPDDALVLWRGPPADGLRLPDAAPWDEWMAVERRRLEAMRTQALARSAAQREAAGAYEPALQRIRTLLAADALQEQHHVAAMRLLDRLGHREAALAQYDTCARLLADELGLEPMASTRALAATLRGAGSLPVVPVPAPTSAPGSARSIVQLPERLPFVGREREVDQLETAWPARGLWWIEGEGGIGKSRLAVDFCASHGAYAWARCRPGDHATPYAAFTRALRTLAGDALASAELPAWIRDELARVVPELGCQPAPMTAAEERARFHEACAQAWLSLGDDSFDAVVIDDWHLADDASAALLAFIVDRLGPASPRVLLLARPLPAATPLAESAALRLRLEPLPAEAVAELVRQLSQVHEPSRFAQRLRRATGGNPYFIAETLRHLADTGALHVDPQGRWSTDHDAVTVDYRELPLPATVRDAVLARVQRLPEASRRLLEAASLAGGPFTPALLAAACALSEVEALAAIEQAQAAALLREHEGAGFTFAHDLAEQALQASLPTERRRLVHRRLALGAESTRASPARVAHHFEAGGEPARALPYRIQAGDEAQRLYAPAQALEHWQAALTLGATPAQAALLHGSCARACADLGKGDEAQAHLGRIDALWSAGLLDAEQDIAAQIECADVELQLSRADRALPRMEALLPRLPAGPPRAIALRVQGRALQSLGQLDEAQQQVHAALSLWPEPGHAGERAELLDILCLIEHQRGQPQRALELAQQARALWRALAHRRGIVRSHLRVGTALCIIGESDAGAAELQEARRLAAELHLVDAERDAINNLLKIHADRGEVRAMLELAEEAWNLSPTFSQPRVRLRLLQAMCHAQWLLGDLGRCLVRAEEFLAEAAASGEPAVRQSAVLSALDLLICLGDFERGRGLLRELQQLGTQGAYYGVKLAMNRAYLEFKAGDVVASQEALAGIGEPTALQDRVTLALRRAELLWAQGDAEASLALLEPWRDGAPKVELQALIGAQRLRAQQALGRVDMAEWAAARAVLDTGRLPPGEALDLRRALWLSAPPGPLAQELERSVDTAVAQLAASLDHHPQARRAFLVQHGRHGGNSSIETRLTSARRTCAR